MENPYIVYAKTNDFGYITAVNSSAFLEDMTGWTEIDSGFGDKYHHAQENYFTNPIMRMDGAYCYSLVDGKPKVLEDDEIRIQLKEQGGNLTVEQRLSALERSAFVDSYTAGKWYYRGDRVRFDQNVYTCIAPDGVVCVWSPLEYPAYWTM